jgi:hypothetical protein
MPEQDESLVPGKLRFAVLKAGQFSGSEAQLPLMDAWYKGCVIYL